jgi:hypothetical protein
MLNGDEKVHVMPPPLSVHQEADENNEPNIFTYPYQGMPAPDMA